jgi:hypothetical protein
VFFVSVAFKGFNVRVSSLKSTLMRRFVSVDFKGLRESRKWKSENGKWQRGAGANGAPGGEGFEGIVERSLVSTDE